MRTSSLLALVALACACAPARAAPRRLEFNSAGKFKILQLTDIHLGEEPYVLGVRCAGSDKTDVQALNLAQALAASERPDLVVLTGDFAAGYCFDQSMTGKARMRQKLEELYTVFGWAGVPWAACFGNHDDQGPMTRDEIVEFDQSFNGSLTLKGPSDIFGVANYYLPVFANAQSTIPSALLWVLATSDSDYGKRSCEGTYGEGCISTAQLQWFINSSQSLTKSYGLSQPPFSFMFFHIAVQEYVDAWNKDTCFGTRGEKISCSKVNTGLYEAAASQGVRGTFCGHDHKNEFCGALSSNPNLSMCYGRKTGYGSYGTSSLPKGGRVIEITLNGQDVAWNTWIREEGGAIVVQKEHKPAGSDQEVCNTP